jgi:hypothetical protein
MKTVPELILEHPRNHVDNFAMIKGWNEIFD